MLRATVSGVVIRFAAVCGAVVGAWFLFVGLTWVRDRFSATNILIVLMTLSYIGIVVRMWMLVHARLVAVEQDIRDQRICLAAVNSAIDKIETALEANVWF